VAPLEGIRVLDLTRLFPGGFCTQLLADFGAEVIKVEDTGAGDYIRQAPPFYGGELDPGQTASALYLSLNRNKKSIRLDLKNDEGRAAFLKLATDADVVVEGFRPGVAARLGVDYETVREVNPGIVYCSITGYGQDGPYRDRAGHDINYQASTGILGMTGLKDGQPVLPAVQVGDLGGGALPAAFGILTALFEKQRSGRGQMVDISMTDGAMAWLAMVAGRHFADGTVPRRGEMELTGGLACYMPYEAADGWVACGALEPKFWKAFCEGAGHPDLVEHQFDPPGSPGWEKVAEVFRSRTRDEWKAFNDEHDCCIEPILEVGEALTSELARERGMVIEFEQPGVGTVRQVGNPVSLSETPADTSGAAPAIGADTVEVLVAAGMSPEEVNALISSGAAAGPGGEVEGGEFRV
jgi:crotonobetainyl-CoA:carnitine CoA-transferase CaiB-like acyl-CoA transferase